MRRSRYATVTWVAAISGLATALIAPLPRLVWNATASTPIGLYRIAPERSPHVGDIVAATPPAPLAVWMAARDYAPRTVPLMKRVAAIGGQQVCRIGATVWIDGIAVAVARERDHAGRPLPRWSGCRALAADQVFLLNPAVRDSFDGRYFGPLPSRSIIGRAIPLWIPPPHAKAPVPPHQRSTS